MTDKELARKIAGWVGTEIQASSGWLSPYIDYTVNAHSLLDFLVDTTGMTREEIGDAFEWGKKDRADYDPAKSGHLGTKFEGKKPEPPANAKSAECQKS